MAGNLSEEVKRQALAAVEGRESTTFIRRYWDDAYVARLFSAPIDTAPAARGVMEESVKAQAMDAIREWNLRSLVRPAVQDGEVFAMPTPSRGAQHAAAQITGLYRAGFPIDAVHSHATKDCFERSHD